MPKESEEINIQKLKNDYPDFLKKTPSEVIDFILSEKTSSQIAEICIKNGVKDEEKIEGVARRIVWVVLGKLPKESLSITFEKGLGLDSKTSKKLSGEVNKLIFSQITLPEKKETIEEIPKTIKKDIYRELVE